MKWQWNYCRDLPIRICCTSSSLNGIRVSHRINPVECRHPSSNFNKPSDGWSVDHRNNFWRNKACCCNRYADTWHQRFNQPYPVLSRWNKQGKNAIIFVCVIRWNAWAFCGDFIQQTRWNISRYHDSEVCLAIPVFHRRARQTLILKLWLSSEGINDIDIRIKRMTDERKTQKMPSMRCATGEIQNHYTEIWLLTKAKCFWW